MFRIGHGSDVHALAAGLPLRLCGVDIVHTKGCVAHSDGDVAVHALCDALLGAVAEGDIGKHFPDSDSQWRGINSIVLLKQVTEIVNRKGYAIGNVDITIEAQLPRLAPYIYEMRTVLAEAMAINVSQLSVKATTTEHLGFVGREEGIAADAVVLLESFRSDLQ